MENPFKFLRRKQEVETKVLFDQVLPINVRVSSLDLETTEELFVRIKVEGGFAKKPDGRTVSIYCPIGEDFIATDDSITSTSSAFDGAMNKLEKHLYSHEMDNIFYTAAFKFRLKNYIIPGIKTLKSQLPK